MGKQLLQQRHLDKLCTQLADYWRNCQRSQQQLWHVYYTSIILRVFSCARLQVHSFLCKEESKTCYVYENATDTQYACQFMTQQNQQPQTHIQIMHVYICTYVCTRILVSCSRPTFHTGFASTIYTNVLGLGTLSMFRDIGSLGRFRPLRLLVCIVIMPYQGWVNQLTHYVSTVETATFYSGTHL